MGRAVLRGCTNSIDAAGPASGHHLLLISAVPCSNVDMRRGLILGLLAIAAACTTVEEGDGGVATTGAGTTTGGSSTPWVNRRKPSISPGLPSR